MSFILGFVFFELVPKTPIVALRFAKLEKVEEKADFRSNLKSTGKDKFALEEVPKEDDKVNFRDQLKSAKEREEDRED